MGGHICEHVSLGGGDEGNSHAPGRLVWFLLGYHERYEAKLRRLKRDGLVVERIRNNRIPTPKILKLLHYSVLLIRDVV